MQSVDLDHFYFGRLREIRYLLITTTSLYAEGDAKTR